MLLADPYIYVPLLYVMSQITSIPTIHDQKGTSKLRSLILENGELSKDLAEAIGTVFSKYGFKPTDDQLVAFEPVVTKRVSKKQLKPLAEGSSNPVFADDLSVGIHVVETRQPLLNYAITQSAWNG